MSAETERSVGGSVDLRNDLGGGEWYTSDSSRTPGVPPASIGDPASLCPAAPQFDGHEDGQNDQQKTSDLSTESSSFDGEAAKNILLVFSCDFIDCIIPVFRNFCSASLLLDHASLLGRENSIRLDLCLFHLTSTLHCTFVFVH